MKDIKLYFTALFLLPIVNFLNKKLVKKKGGNLEKYDIDRAISIDKFAGREYRTFFNHYLVKADSDYKIGVENETISSALGKIKVDGKLTSKEDAQDWLGKWFHGKSLSDYLTKVFKQKDHCIESIDVTVGDWKHNSDWEELKKNHL